MGCMSHIEHHAQTTLYTSHVVGSKLTKFVSCWILIHIHLAD